MSEQSPLRILFAGNPEIGVPSLRALAEEAPPGAPWEVCGVLTHPDKPSGRGKKLRPSPVAQAAAEMGLSLFQPEKLNAAFREEVSRLAPDLLVVIAYGKIFGPRFLGLFPHGGINMHPSRLPLYRGPSPLSAVIAAGESETALTVQQLALEMDSGDILLQVPLTLAPRETTASLTDRVAREAAPLMVKVVSDLAAGQTNPRPQEHDRATYCSLVTKEDGRLDWSRTAGELDCQVRACVPWPLAWTHWGNLSVKVHQARPLGENESFSGDPGLPGAGEASPGQVLGVDKKKGFLVKTGGGLLLLETLQLPGRKALEHHAFMNGNRDFAKALLE